MAWFVLLGALAAFGALCAVWAILGWFLPRGEGCALVCVGEPDIGTVSRWKWLTGMGWLCCPMLIVTDEQLPCMDEETERCSRAELLSRLEMERNRFDGTGNGNSSGRHQRRGISEL